MPMCFAETNGSCKICADGYHPNVNNTECQSNVNNDKSITNCKHHILGITTKCYQCYSNDRVPLSVTHDELACESADYASNPNFRSRSHKRGFAQCRIFNADKTQCAECLPNSYANTTNTACQKVVDSNKAVMAHSSKGANFYDQPTNWRKKAYEIIGDSNYRMQLAFWAEGRHILKGGSFVNSRNDAKIEVSIHDKPSGHNFNYGGRLAMKNPFAGNFDEEAADLDDNVDGTYRSAQCKLDFPMVGDPDMALQCGQTRNVNGVDRIVKCNNIYGDSTICNNANSTCENKNTWTHTDSNVAQGAGYKDIPFHCKPGHYLFKTRHEFEIDVNPPDSTRLLEQVSKVSQKDYKDYSKLLNGEDLKSKLEIWNKQFEKTRKKNLRSQKSNTQQATSNRIQFTTPSVPQVDTTTTSESQVGDTTTLESQVGDTTTLESQVDDTAQPIPAQAKITELLAALVQSGLELENILSPLANAGLEIETASETPTVEDIASAAATAGLTEELVTETLVNSEIVTAEEITNALAAAAAGTPTAEDITNAVEAAKILTEEDIAKIAEAASLDVGDITSAVASMEGSLTVDLIAKALKIMGTLSNEDIAKSLEAVETLTEKDITDALTAIGELTASTSEITGADISGASSVIVKATVAIGAAITAGAEEVKEVARVIVHEISEHLISQSENTNVDFEKKLKESIDKLDQVTNKNGRTQECKDTYPVSTELTTEADQLNCGQNLWCGNPEYPYCSQDGKCVKKIGSEKQFRAENSKDIYAKNYGTGSDRAGTFGGNCTCNISGLTYQISDHSNSCGTFNCNGGTTDRNICNRKQGPWSFMKVDCATTRPLRDYQEIPENCKPFSYTFITKPMYIRKHKKEYFTGRGISDNSKAIAFEGLELSYNDVNGKFIERVRGYFGYNKVKFIVKMPLKFEQQYNRAIACNKKYPLTSQTKMTCGSVIHYIRPTVINIFFFF